MANSIAQIQTPLYQPVWAGSGRLWQVSRSHVAPADRTERPGTGVHGGVNSASPDGS